MSEDVECDSIAPTFLYTVVTFQGFVVLSDLVIWCFAFYQFCISSRKIEISQTVRIVCLTALTAHSCTGALTVLTVTEFSKCPQLRWKSWLYIFSFYSMTITGSIGLLSTYCLMVIRVKFALLDTLFELSKKILLCSWSFITFQILMPSLGLTASIIILAETGNDHWASKSDIALFYMAFWLLNYSINFIIILIVFIKKLRLLSEYLFANSTKSQKKLLYLGIKTVLCCGVAIGSTLTITFGLLIIAAANNNYSIIILYSLTTLDSIINSICLILQWPFTLTIYDKTCGKCVKRCGCIPSNQ